jgi:DNA-binding beta-propeller fold protein YncE
MSFVHARTRCALLLCAFGVLTPAAAPAAPTPKPSRQPLSALGSLVQLSGRGGCLADRSEPGGSCARVRGLSGSAPFVGSHALAISPDGRNVYVASSRSNAIAIFTRNARTGALTQHSGAAGCIALLGSGGCAKAIGLGAPNSVAVSADGKNVYATSLAGNAVVSLHRSSSTGALTQLGEGTGCIANVATTGCTTGRALDGPDVVAISPDGTSVYAGAFAGNAVAVFSRDTSTGALAQPPDATGCVVQTPIAGCTTGLGLGNPEGLVISPGGTNLYVAAPGSNALDTFTRNSSTGALTQATDGTGCIVDVAVTGCTTGRQLGGADAVAISPTGASVYVTSALSNSVTTFAVAAPGGQLTQLTGTSACLVNLLAVGCSLARTLNDPEGLAVSPDGASVYAAAFRSNALDVFNRNSGSGAVTQKPRAPGCLIASVTSSCLRGRALLAASSVAVSPDGKNVYSAAFTSNAVGIFKRVTKAMTR